MTIFNLPDLGEGLPDAEIVRWLVKAGHQVALGQTLVEMETAKAIVEVPSPQDGQIKQLYGKAGDIIKTGEPLIAFEEQSSTNINLTENPIPPTSQGELFIFKLPDLGEGLPDAEIVEWHIKVGDPIGKDQTLVSMETAKAIIDVPSPVAGTIIRCLGEKGDIVKTGEILIEIATAKQATTQAYATNKKTQKDTRTFTPSQVIKAGPAAKNRALKYALDINQIKTSDPKGFITIEDVENAANTNRTAPVSAYKTDKIFDIPSGKSIRAAPKIRAYAKRMNADLQQIKTSGHYGNVTLQDVTDWLNQQQAATMQTGDAQIIPIRGARRSMFSSMSQARDRVMNTTIFDDANITAWTQDTDVTLRFIRAIINACQTVPALNTWLDDENQNIIQHKHINIGIAVDSENGLYVPVIKKVNTKQPASIRNELNILRNAIKTRSIKTQDLQNATITLSNFGMIAGRYATPVVTPPQVSILATGGVYEAPSVTAENEIKLQKFVPLSLSFDHRAVTGGEVARFLAALKADLVHAQ